MLNDIKVLYNYLKTYSKYSALLIKKIARYDVDSVILKSHELKPTNGTDYQKLGEGSEGAVYLAQFNGTPVAAKINYGQSILEARKWKDINKLDLPPQYKKHLPVIYFCWPEPCGENILPSSPNVDLPQHQIIVTEVLEPLSGKALDTLFPDLEEQNGYYNRLVELKENDQLLNATVEYSTYNSGLSPDDLQVLKGQLINFLKTYQPPSNPDNEMLEKIVREDLFEYIYSVLPELESDEFSSMLDNLFSDDSSSKEVEADRIAESFVNYTAQQQFPYGYSMWSSGSNTEYFLNHPVSKELTETLLYIVENSGIAWADVKPQNLMMRPSTGDIVIIDVGRYNKL